MAQDVLKSRDGLFIGGQWAKPATSEIIEVVSPHTEQVVATVPAGSPADMDAAVTAARTAFDEGEWGRMGPTDRLAILSRMADLYESRVDEMAAVITGEMGGPIAQTSGRQVPGVARTLRTLIQIGRDHPWEQERKSSTGTPVILRREPVGVVAAIVPWNMPQSTTMSKIIPALIAGCTIVLKPAPETPLDANLVAEIVSEAGLPPGVLNIVPADREAGEHLVRHALIDKVSFTGSTTAGRLIASICGQDLKRCSLELGGKSAAIVLEDADLTATMNGLRHASFPNSGQACVAQTRVLAPRSRYDEIVDGLAEVAGSMRVGDPYDQETEIGPMVSPRQRDRVEGYIALGEQEGAKVAVGGPGGPAGIDKGWYVQPTVFTNVDNKMRIAQEEIFGPVVVVIPYDGVDDAVRIANDSEYGLAGSVWTADAEAGLDVARRVRTGIYGVNRHMVDFANPFGGFKHSGIGREGGPEGLDHYVEFKTINP